MICFCGRKAVYEKAGNALCKEHFIESFEKRVFSTIEEHSLFKDAKSIAVAASGGKDSTVLLYLVKKYTELQKKQHSRNMTLEAIAIDEGIKGYRQETLDFLKSFCKKHLVYLKILSFEEAFGFTLDSAVKKLGRRYGPCTMCGAFRRTLINKAGRGYDVVATGHNLDDEAQGILMNIFKSNTGFLPRLGIRPGAVHHPLFSTRVKPLYFCPEKEVFLYSFLKGFQVPFTECPYAASAYRDIPRRLISELQKHEPLAKEKILAAFLNILPALRVSVEKKEILACSLCREPSAGKVCKACEIKSAFVASGQ